MKILSLIPDKILYDELVELKFKFKIESTDGKDTEDKDFPYPDEIFSVNFGEVGKFPASLVYQSKFLVLRDGNYLNFNGYAPDFGRKSNIIKDKNDNNQFKIGQTYSVTIRMDKYRVYIDVDDGFAKTSYGNGRDGVDEVAFYVRNGTKATVSEVELKGMKMPELEIDENIKYFIDNQLIGNYLNYHVGFDGVYFDRLSVEQNIKCTTRNSGAYQSCVCIDAYTDLREISLEFEVTDIPCPSWPTQFGFLVNGKRVDQEIVTTEKDKTYVKTFKICEDCGKYNRLTIFFPYSVSMALKKIIVDKSCKFKAPQKNGWIYFYGDSITEGSECFNPASVYVSQVCTAYNYHGLDQAVSGRTFNDYNVLGTYYHQPDYVFIANGTNSFCAGMGKKEEVFVQMEKDMVFVIESAKNRFPNAKIIALLPIWRSDEDGINFSLFDTVEKIKEVYARYKDISVIDCHEFVPKDYDYFSDINLAIHPNSKGHDEYGKNLLKELEKVIGKPVGRDESLLAKEALKN